MIPLLLMAGASIAEGLASEGAYRDQAMQARIASVRRRLRASDDARLVEEQGGRFQANQAVGFAQSGVLLDQGSPLQVLMDTAINVERNAMRTRLAGEWDADGLEASASAYDKMATGAMLKGIAGAASVFLSGVKGKVGSFSPSKAMTQKQYFKYTPDFPVKPTGAAAPSSGDK